MAETSNVMNDNLADSIAMLEQILEVMPQDFDALKTLYDAYSKCNNPDRAFEYLRRMVDVAALGGDPDGMAYTVSELRRHEAGRPVEVQEMMACLRPMAGESEVSQPVPTLPSSAEQSCGAPEMDVGEELALAWRLYEDGQLTQEEYSSVLHDLTEISSRDLDVPVSVLHVLHDRNFPQMNRIMNYMSTRSGVPCVSLQQFELVDEAAKVLPLDVSVHEGALPFGFFGDDLLVGVLNPFNGELVARVNELSGQRCHTYLVAPEDYDRKLSELRSAAA